MLIADLVLVPVQASQFDVWVLEKMAKLIEDAQGFNEGLKSALVVNRAPTNPAITEEEDLRNFLSELPGMTPLKNVDQGTHCLAQGGKARIGHWRDSAQRSPGRIGT